MSRETERRHYPRATIEWPTRIRQGGFFVDGVTKNLSHGGALICCDHYMSPGERVRVAVMLLDRLPLIVDAEVMRSTLLSPDFMCGLFGTAVRFVSVSAEDLWPIDLEVAEKLVSKCLGRQARAHNEQISPVCVFGERRRYPRLVAEWLVRIDTRHGWVHGRTVDVSAAGAFICCQQPVEESAKFNIAFVDVPSLNRPLKVKAEVVRSGLYRVDHGTPRHGFAVKFIGICKEDRAFLSALISAHLNASHIWLKSAEIDELLDIADSSERDAAA